MSSDPASLERLHDILVPPPTPWWPPAPGWIWLLGILAVVAAVALLRGLVRWQRNRYRREALAELRRLEQSADNAPADNVLLDMAALLKRVAITAYSREQVAGLTGGDWFAFLDRTGGTNFGAGLGQALEAANYRVSDARWDAEKIHALAAAIRTWIKCHGAQRQTPVGEETTCAQAIPEARGP